ncbi:MAG: hypothetical protein CMJ79_06170 [Planctomycetaceae bacterium]|nr:hypothetical protein [Planctomycetaceae bacterium]
MYFYPSLSRLSKHLKTNYAVGDSALSLHGMILLLRPLEKQASHDCLQVPLQIVKMNKQLVSTQLN